MDSIAIGERFGGRCGRSHKIPEAFDQMVRKDFVITSGGRDIVRTRSIQSLGHRFSSAYPRPPIRERRDFSKPGREPCCVPVEAHWAQQRCLGHGGQ